MNDFTTELRALLDKYKATISWGCAECSDLHGVYGEYMEVCDIKGNTILKLDGATISCYEIDMECE
jgi:hypothetical protein